MPLALEENITLHFLFYFHFRSHLDITVIFISHFLNVRVLFNLNKASFIPNFASNFFIKTRKFFVIIEIADF